MYIVHKIHLATPRTVLTYTIVRSTFTYLTTMKDKDIFKKGGIVQYYLVIGNGRHITRTKRYKTLQTCLRKNVKEFFFIFNHRNLESLLYIPNRHRHWQYLTTYRKT